MINATEPLLKIYDHPTVLFNEETPTTMSLLDCYTVYVPTFQRKSAAFILGVTDHAEPFQFIHRKDEGSTFLRNVTTYTMQ